MPNIVEDLLQRLAHIAPQVSEQQRWQLVSEMSREHGGTEVYWPKKPPIAQRQGMLVAGLRQQKTLAQCFADASVSRRTGYRVLARK